jgi:hypothetical protein
MADDKCCLCYKTRRHQRGLFVKPIKESDVTKNELESSCTDQIERMRSSMDSKVAEVASVCSVPSLSPSSAGNSCCETPENAWTYKDEITRCIVCSTVI